ncbi:hypothetical protein [Psychrobacillus sp. NPDC093180]|uniref:hypothetical protein n=1 Tax=Psychrobacillus sp. NPDC093180 TaxID=3364489 RepID=UPI00382C6EB3
MILLPGVLFYLLIGLFFFLSVIKGNDLRAHARYFALAAPFIIVGYPYFFVRRVLKM